MVDHIAKPTRPPGRYELSWDGVDDHGRPVEQGDYILHVEASREHGGHQYEKIPLTLRDEALKERVAAGSELGQINITFGSGERRS